MNLIVLPSIICCCIKLYLMYVNRFSLTKDKSVFTALLGACALHSLCEAIGFSLWSAGVDVSILYRLYYILTIWFLCFMLLYSIEVGTKAKLLGYIFMFTTLLISALLLSTDYLISGYVDNNGVLNSEKSESYWIFKIYVFSLILTSLCSLAWKILTSRDRKKSIYVLVAILAPFTVIAVVMVLVDLGYQVNSMAVVPIATTFMFLFIILSENDHLLTDIKRSLPWSKEKQLANKMIILMEKLSRREITRKEYNFEHERLSLEYLLAKTNGKSVNDLARKTGEPVSTMYRLLQKHNLKLRK